MTTATLSKNNTQEQYLEEIVKSSKQVSSPIASIQEKQAQALARIKELGFPNKKSESWKYYNPEQILEANFALNLGNQGISEENKARYQELISQHVYTETTNSLLVTIDGAFSPKLSNLSAFNQKDLKILNFNDPEQMAAEPESQAIVEKHFAKNIKDENNFFKAINTALMSKGFLLDVKDNFHSENTLHVLHISHSNSFNQTRSLINIGKNAELKIIVNYIGLDDAQYFTNAAIEVFLADNAKLKLNKIQNESRSAIQMYNLYAELNRDSNFEFNAFSFGSSVSKDEIIVDVNQSGAHASINGLYVLQKQRRSHNEVVMNHNVSNTTSGQVFKGLLYDQSRSEFYGVVNIAKDAQQVDAAQLNKNLLLSDQAHADSRPQMNIYADDVKCAHGATVGQIDEEELFYLQSRGMSKNEAITMLTYSFCDELIKNVELESARDVLAKLAVKNLSQGLVLIKDEPVTKQCLN